MFNKKTYLENVIEHDLAVIESFKQIGISKETIIRYYKVELELETKFIDYVLLTYSAKENKIIEYKERIKKSITY